MRRVGELCTFDSIPQDREGVREHRGKLVALVSGLCHVVYMLNMQLWRAPVVLGRRNKTNCNMENK